MRSAIFLFQRHDVALLFLLRLSIKVSSSDFDFMLMTGEDGNNVGLLSGWMVWLLCVDLAQSSIILLIWLQEVLDGSVWVSGEILDELVMLGRE